MVSCAVSLPCNDGRVLFSMEILRCKPSIGKEYCQQVFHYPFQLQAFHCASIIQVHYFEYFLSPYSNFAIKIGWIFLLLLRRSYVEFPAHQLRTTNDLTTLKFFLLKLLTLYDVYWCNHHLAQGVKVWFLFKLLIYLAFKDNNGLFKDWDPSGFGFWDFR